MNGHFAIKPAVLLSSPSLAASYGGPGRSIPALASALYDRGRATVLMTPAGFEEVDRTASTDNVHRAFRAMDAFRPFPTFLEEAWCVGRQRGIKVVHDNGIWSPFNRLVCRYAKGLAARRVISPRGMLEPWALGYKKTRKSIAWSAYQRADLVAADALHATSIGEYQSIRRIGLKQPVAIIPNGLNIPESIFAKREEPIRSAIGCHSAIFIGRLHPKKGLLMLIEAWAQCQPSGWNLQIVGPDEGSHLRELEALVRTHELNSVIHFHSEVSEEQKWHLMRGADLFVLPTYSENFGNVVVEALSAGAPVLTTTGTPWSEIVDRDCGWYVEPTVQGLCGALRNATSLSRLQLRAMGRRGQELVKEKYLLSEAANAMDCFYDAVVNGGDWPDCVVFT